MRRVILTLSLLSSIAVFGKGIKINGTLSNIEDGKFIYLYEMLGTESQIIDSCRIKKGIFSYKGNLERGFYLLGFNTQNNLMLILGEESIEMSADATNLLKTAKITNSKEWDLQNQFNTFNTSYTQSMQGLQAQINFGRSLTAKNPAKSQQIFQQVQLDYDSLTKARTYFYTDLIKKNSTTFTAKVARFYLKADSLKQDECFTQPELQDAEMQRGEMWVAMVSTYFQKYLVNQSGGILEASLAVINTQKEGSKERELLFISFIRNSLMVDPKIGSQLGKIYTKEFPDSYYQKTLVALLPDLPIDIGDMAPEIVEKTPDGEELRLSSTRGNVVLLDFWASWCGPCRKENPNVVKAYQKYKDKGFTVFSVSLDNDASKWKYAIQKDGLVWPSHVSDLKGWKAAPAKKYSVNSIPATFLIDKNGKIVARNLRGHELDKKLEELLGKD